MIFFVSGKYFFVEKIVRGNFFSPKKLLYQVKAKKKTLSLRILVVGENVDLPKIIHSVELTCDFFGDGYRIR